MKAVVVSVVMAVVIGVLERSHRHPKRGRLTSDPHETLGLESMVMNINTARLLSQIDALQYPINDRKYQKEDMSHA